MFDDIVCDDKGVGCPSAGDSDERGLAKEAKRKKAQGSEQVLEKAQNGKENPRRFKLFL
jgi:hypothetical protein